MEIFFKIAAFSQVAFLVFLALRENVKTKKRRVVNFLSVFVISLIFSYLIDLTKWAIIYVTSKF
jgi:hypothetical protein